MQVQSFSIPAEESPADWKITFTTDFAKQQKTTSFFIVFHSGIFVIVYDVTRIMQ